MLRDSRAGSTRHRSCHAVARLWALISRSDSRREENAQRSSSVCHRSISSTRCLPALSRHDFTRRAPTGQTISASSATSEFCLPDSTVGGRSPSRTMTSADLPEVRQPEYQRGRSADRHATYTSIRLGMACRNFRRIARSAMPRNWQVTRRTCSCRAQHSASTANDQPLPLPFERL